MVSSLASAQSTTPGITCQCFPETKSTVAIPTKTARLCSFCLRTPTDGDVLSSEQALARVRQDLANRRADLLRRKSSQTPPDPGWFSKVAINFRGGSGRFLSGVARLRLTHGSESSSLAQELQGLEALEYEMSKNLEVLRQLRENARFSTTLKGRVFAIIGHGFAVYCIFRVISVSVNAPNNESLFTYNASVCREPRRACSFKRFDINII